MKHNLLRILALVTIIFAVAFSSNPPDGRTGAPGDGLCSNCHSAGSQQGNVEITGVPGTIVPGQTYNIGIISTTNTNSSLGGFQMVVLDVNDENIGTLTNPSPASTVTPAGNGRTYHEHQPAIGFGGGPTVSWSVDWTAPTNGPTGNISFYAASVLANGNGSTSGDGVVTTSEAGSFVGAPPLVANITSSMDVSCNGDMDGSATVMATGGNMPYSYLWSNGETMATATMLPAGMATVTVTDDGNDMVTASVSIGAPPAIILVVDVINDISCNGDNDGQASADAAGGAGSFTYLWSDGQSTMIATGLGPGIASVTVTDADGCQESGSVTIMEPTPLTVTLVSQTNITCAGFNDGMATVLADGGTPGYIYNWADGQTGPTAVNLIAGVTMVTATDANGCTEMLTVTITEPAPISLSISSQNNVSCFGGNDGSASIAVTGGTAGYTFLWSDGQTNPTAVGLSAGTVTCMVTDANDCVEMIVVNISQPSEIVIDLDITNESGPGANDGSIIANATGGMSPYDYVWSNGTNGAANLNLMPGNYTVTVTDDNDCEQSASGTVMGSGCDLTVDIVVIQGLECPDDADGILTYTTNNTLTNITWSTGASTDTIDNLNAGVYSITVTDVDDCVSSASISLSGSDNEIPEFLLDTLCLFIDSSGTAVLDSMTLFDNLIDNCDANPTADYIEIVVDCDDSGLVSENIIVRDATGNVGPQTIYLMVADTITPQFVMVPDDITVNTCDSLFYTLPEGMDNCGDVMVNLVSGIGSGQVFPVGTTIETYEILDQFGNRNTTSFSITVVSDLAPEISTMDASCSDSQDGVALINATGGTMPYSFGLTPNVVDPFALSPGTYAVRIEDDANCVVLDTFTISAPDSLFVDSLTVTDVSTPGGFDGSIEINITGGTTPYDVTWLLDTSFYANQEDILNLFAGFYSVTIIDENGCEFEIDSIEVEEMSSTSNPTLYDRDIELFVAEKMIVTTLHRPIGEYVLEVMDMKGQLVMVAEKLDGDRQLDLRHIQAGQYVARVITTDGRIKTKLFVLN